MIEYENMQVMHEALTPFNLVVYQFSLICMKK